MLMAARGPRLFGQAFPASPLQRKHWQVVAGGNDTAPEL